MKIVFLIDSMDGGGAERVAQLLSQGISAEGHEIVVISIVGDAGVFPLHSSVEREPPLLGARNLSTRMKLLCLPFMVPRLYLRLRRIGADVCLSFLTLSNLLNVVAGAFFSSWSVVITEHNIASAVYRGRRMERRVVLHAIRCLYRYADYAIGVSDGVVEELSRLGVSLSRCRRIYNPIALEEIALEQPVSRGGGNQLVVMVASFTEQKSHEILVEALQLIPEAERPCTWLVGEGPRLELIRELVGQKGLEEWVKFLGWRDDRFSVMKAADLLVHTASWEGFGLVLLEAIACGTAVVATDCPTGPREVLGELAEYCLVPMNRPEEFASRMRHLLGNKSLRDRIEKMGIRRARDFSVSTASSLYISAFEHVTTPRRGAT